jgi:RNA polymerase sigma factor (sigma-70 family)
LAGDATDACLLERFVAQQDGDAFAELIGRHGPLVLRVCRRILHRPHDVEDAFQATFLILARRAPSMRNQRSLAGWLYTVAQRVAWGLRAGSARRRGLEQPFADLQWVEEELAASRSSTDSDPARLAQRRELEAVIEQEVGRLPEKYRAPLILCDLRGRTHAEAAQELGLPPGSVSRHLERGRDLLRERLVRRGVGLGSTALAALLVDKAPAAVPTAWASTAAQAAVPAAAGSALPAGLVSDQAVSLSQGVLKAMWMKKLQTIIVILLAFGLLAGGASLLGLSVLGGPEPQAAAQGKGLAVNQQPAAQPAARAVAPPGLRRICDVTEKMMEPPGMIFPIAVKGGGMFFSADSDTVFVQRGGGIGGGIGGIGGGGLGIGGGGAVGGAGVMGRPAGQGGPDTYREYLGAWNLTTRKKVKEVANCQNVALSPDGNSLAMIGIFKNNKQSVRLVDAKTLKVTQEADLQVAKPAAGAGGLAAFPVMWHGPLVFSPDGKRLLLQNYFDTYRWDINSNKVTKVLSSPFLQVLGFLPGGKTILALGMPNLGLGALPAVPGKAPLPVADTGGFGAWNLANGKLTRRFGDPAIPRATLAPTGTSVATYSYGAFAFGGGIGGIGGIGGGAGAVGGAGALGGAGAGGVGLLGGLGGPIEPAKIQLWDVVTGKSALTIDTKIVPEQVKQKAGNVGFMAFTGGVQDVAFSPDGRLLAASLGSGEGGFVQVFDARTGREIARQKVEFCPQAIAFSRDGSLLATAGGLGAFELRVYDVPGQVSPGEQRQLHASQLPDLWRDLAAHDLPRALRAERTLAAGAPELILPLLREQLKPVPSGSEEGRRMLQLLTDLESEQFKVRDKATQELVKGGTAALAALRYALKEDRSIEFRRRGQALLTKLEEATTPTPEQRRLQHALGVLETRNSPEARQLLDQLAGGAPEVWLTQEAQAVKQRLDERKSLP